MSKTIFVIESSEFEPDDKSKGVVRLVILINLCLPYFQQKENQSDIKKFVDKVELLFLYVSIIMN